MSLVICVSSKHNRFSGDDQMKTKLSHFFFVCVVFAFAAMEFYFAASSPYPSGKVKEIFAISTSALAATCRAKNGFGCQARTPWANMP